MSSYETETKQAYQDPERALRYKRQIEGWNYAGFALRRQLVCVADAVKRIGIGPSSSVLDIPCGTGVLASVLRPTGAEIVLGDISGAMLGFAREAYGRTHVRSVIRADIVDLPLGDGSVSSAVCLGLMHRIPDEVRWPAVRELARVARGPIIVSFSAFDRMQSIKRALIHGLRPGFQFAAHPVTLSQLRASINRKGLRMTRIYRPIPFVSSEIIAVLSKR